MSADKASADRASAVKALLLPTLFLPTIFPPTLCLPTAVYAEELSPYAKAMGAYHERRLEEALRYARQAVKQDPGHVDAYALLGELYYLRQELAQAKASWEQALKLAPSRQDLRERLATLQREATVEGDLARHDTYPFVVRFAEGQTPVDLGDLRLLLRDTYRMVGQQFNYFPDHAIAVILYPQGQFEQVKGLSHRVAGFYDGKIRLPMTAGLRTSQGLQRVFWHEYTHAVVHDLAKGKCPLWLNEGLAMVQEARVQPPDLDEMRQALQAKRLPSWSQLWQETEHSAADSLEVRYGEAYLIAHYLVKLRGWTQMAGLLKRLSVGVPIDDALKAEYRRPQAELEREWLAWARRELGVQ